jgi:hypothetical protein
MVYTCRKSWISTFLGIYYLNEFNAGMMYWEGAEGIKSNKKAALVWFEKIK